ncbi:hypothetical protein QO034_05065 [Sedimentitalea sp. JM2-8]|uniref:RNase NYN domain-containing protein n=1 Tax=Sedimentitalea xiamensis TaxID=3050037 RepID=A0ABT7FBJ0_9RHOB|nr:hypothetical protein [Sedimentitalea xiamensis]MDK3072477.1 hypothetical protein [Sedimentitalea xiamensis]
MIFAILLFLISLLGLVAALANPAWGDLILLAGPCAAAGLVLLIRAGVRRRGQRPRSEPGQWIVLDGSNVMYWKDGTPRIETVREVLLALSGPDLEVGVMFDANAGYLLFDRYTHDRAFATLLGLPEDNVMVVPKGTPADPYILAAARKLGARIVTNDRFRDWAGDHPEIRRPGHLIRGGYRSGRLWLDRGGERAVETGPARRAKR